MFVSARDAVVVMRRINDGNEFTIISTSVEVPEVVVEKGFERAQVILSAFNLKPIGEGVNINIYNKLVNISHSNRSH